MLDGTGGDPSTHRRWRARWGRIPLRAWGTGVGVLALAASGLFGGLDPVRVPGLPIVAVGAAHPGAPWTVTVTGAGVTTDAKPLRLARQGDRWFAVGATVEVTADESRGDTRDVLRLRNVPGLRDQKPSQVVLQRDGTTLTDLHPGLPEKVLLLWEQAGDATVPTEVEVEIYGKTLRVNSLTGGMDWLDPEPKALVRLPVKDLDKP